MSRSIFSYGWHINQSKFLFYTLPIHRYKCYNGYINGIETREQTSFSSFFSFSSSFLFFFLNSLLKLDLPPDDLVSQITYTTVIIALSFSFSWNKRKLSMKIGHSKKHTKKYIPRNIKKMLKKRKNNYSTKLKHL